MRKRSKSYSAINVKSDSMAVTGCNLVRKKKKKKTWMELTKLACPSNCPCEKKRAEASVNVCATARSKRTDIHESCCFTS